MNSASNENKQILRSASKGHKPPVSAGSMTPAGAKGNKDHGTNNNNNTKIMNTSLSEQNRVKQM